MKCKDFGKRNDYGLSDYLEKQGYDSLGKLLEKTVKCDTCGKKIIGEPPAMFFKGGDTDDQRFLCMKCAPNPFNAIFNDL